MAKIVKNDDVAKAAKAISSTRHSSGLVVYSCITQVARNGNLQIEMHPFMSYQLPQR